MIPATGGLFQVELVSHTATYSSQSLNLQQQTYIPPTTAPASTSEGDVKAEKVLLWDRKTEGGFPETKVLKQMVRDRIDPKKDLGHSDVGGKKKDAVKTGEEAEIADVRVDGKVERAAEEAVKDLEVEDAPDGGDVKRNADGTICEDCR